MDEKKCMAMLEVITDTADKISRVLSGEMNEYTVEVLLPTIIEMHQLQLRAIANTPAPWPDGETVGVNYGPAKD